MKRLNTKLLSILAIAGLIVMVGVHVVHGIQTKRNADSLVKRAEETKQTDPRNALWLYERYRSYKPDDRERNADYAMLLADVVQATGDERRYTDAVEALQQAIVNSDDPLELRRKLIELNITFHQFATAKDDLLRLKANGKADSRIDLLLAQCYISSAHYLDAVQLLETLVGYDSQTKSFDASKATAPHELQAYATLAALLHDKVTDTEMPDRAELANRVINQLVTANPDSAKAFLIQAQTLAESKSVDKVKAAIHKALELAPDDAQVLYQATQMALFSNDFAEAEPLIAKALKLYPNDDRFYVLSAQTAQLQKNPTETKQRLDAGLKVLPASIPLLEMYFEQQLQEKDYDGARLTLKKLAGSKQRPELQEYSAARITMAEGNYREAAQQLEHLRTSAGKIPQLARGIDLLLLQCYTGLNEPDKALKAAGNLHDTPQGELGMAASYMAIGKTAEALKHYEHVASWMEQGNNMTGMPFVTKAILDLRIAEQMRKPKEDRDWQAVDALFEKMRAQNLLKEPAASLTQITILARKDENDKARQMMQDVLKQYPDDISVVAAAVRLALQQRQPAEAQRIIEAAPESIRQDPRLIADRIDALFVAGGTKDELKSGLASVAADIEKLPKDARLQLYPNLGAAYIRVGELQTTKQLWDQAVQLDPQNPQFQLLRFDLARDMHDLATMKQIQQWFETEDAGDPAQTKLIEAAVMISSVLQELNEKPVAAGQAAIVLDDAQKRTLLQARDLLQNINDLRPDWVEQPKWLAQIDILENKIDEAIEHLHQVLELGQPNSEIIRQLVKLLYSQHRNDEALELLETYGSLVAGDAEMDRIQAMLDLDTGRPQAALDRMQSRFSNDSTNAGEHLLHGELLARAGKQAEAEAEFRRAIELSPGLAEAWVELIRLKVIEKKPEDGLQVLQEAQIKLPEDQRALVLAQGYEFLNDSLQAEQSYLSALATSPKSLPLLQQVAAFYLRINQVEKAEKYLNEIMSSTPTQPADKECYAWARRTTAQLMAASKDYQQFVKALELLSLPGEKPTADDLTARISLLFDRGDPASSRQALRLLDELKQLRPLNWRERLVLAKLYEQIDNWPAAREEMLSLLAQPKPDPEVYITFVEMLLRRGAADEAVTWLQSLQTLGMQNSPQVAMLAARALSMQGHGPEAAAVLLRLLPTERPLPKDQWPLLRLVASDLVQIGQYDQAEKLFREDVSYEPEQLPTLVIFYAQRGKVDTVLNLCEQNRKYFPAPLMIQIGLGTLRQNVTPPTPEQIQRVEQWLDRALKEDPDSWQLQMELSDFRDFQRRYDDAEKLYRAILARSDVPATQRSVILNNLAFLLAMQGRNRDEAVKLIDEAIHTFGPQSDMLDTRGVVYLSKGDVAQALSDLSDCVIATEPKPIQFVHLAMAQTASKDEVAARASLQRAKELKFNPDDLSPLEKSQYESMLKKLDFTL
ncbi:MAG TPA: tetratricopeptide repeat protein [Pirellulales bacterium]|nr:tetratricopeptide repeat protein [Pirellulales bacterium]